MSDQSSAPIYQGQFGPFTIDDHDRREVLLYRSGLALAALSFALGVGVVLLQGMGEGSLLLASLCFWLMTAGLGLSLWTIHIYLLPLHRALQTFWLVGTITAVYLTVTEPSPLVATVLQQPLTVLGIGFTFAALTGIFFKEAFCFNRLETKLLTPLVPMVLLGHLTGVLTEAVAQWALLAWAALFLVFALRKVVQPIAPDIGDKSVFTYLRQQRQSPSTP